ncbi:PH domain-containing protein [Paenibacillus endoradicis]|uniref:PH domain-containing protein n=1 Tax=Paenibacillus endoradicis TaxID=2972487 RepID=UPI002158FF30|nr:PH domain-containing protein [Paenibacillus endoradicis]MCR8657056.1 PH domain-containing protein [Paenibacillus endoradicis]
MTNPRKLSRLDILFGFLRMLRVFIPMVFVISVNSGETKWLFTLWGLLGTIVILAFSLLHGWITWKKFSFSLEQDRIVIMRGVFNKEEKIIYYNRIHSVNVQQPLLHRVFSVAKLQIETPGGKSGKAEGELRILPIAQAIELQQQLKHYAAIIREGGVIPTLPTEVDGSSFSGEEDLNTAASSQSLHVGTEIDAQHQQVNERTEIPLSNNHYMMEEQLDYNMKLSAGQLLIASLTSLNLSYAIIFIVGIYSFADDFIRFVVPEFNYNQYLDDYSGVSFKLIIALVVVVMLFVWLLSIVLYVIKFGDYHITRSKEQLSIKYGLLEKKSYVFNEGKVQAVIMDENPIRQLLGYAELKVQVITSDANKEQLVIHPFLRKKDMSEIIEKLIPSRNIKIQEKLSGVPIKGLITYALLPMIVVTVVCVISIWFWQFNGLWMMLLYPTIMLWVNSCRVSAGLWLEGNELVLRNRFINRKTYFVARKHIVSLKVKESPRQRKFGLRSISTTVLGSVFAYSVRSLRRGDVESVWNWYSRSK